MSLHIVGAAFLFRRLFSRESRWLVFRSGDRVWLAISPLLMLTTCTWGLPMVGFILVACVIICARAKIAPQNWVFVLAVSAGLMALMEPMLAYFLNAPSPGLEWVAANQHTPWAEFLAQWWPIFLPELALCFMWRQIGPATRLILLLTPLAFGLVEIFNLAWRVDMTGKCWALIYAAAWIVFLPEIARRKAWPHRVLLALITLNSVLRSVSGPPITPAPSTARKSATWTDWASSASTGGRREFWKSCPVLITRRSFPAGCKGISRRIPC